MVEKNEIAKKIEDLMGFEFEKLEFNSFIKKVEEEKFYNGK